MFSGLFAGIMWSLETVVLGIAFSLSPFISTEQAVFLAPFAGTFLHDTFSAIYMFVYNTVRGNLKNVFKVCKTSDFKWIVFASAIGGPVGMTGYVMAVKYMGASVGAVASAIYPAIGTVLAYFFLKERVRWYQWIFLLFALLGVYGLSHSPDLYIENLWLGLCGALMCAFGWGIEAVILAKCFKNPDITNDYALCIRQTVSALIYGIVILPLLKGYDFTLHLFVNGNTAILTVALAALCATVSYLFYYRAINKIGAAKAMALNITYTAWAIFFSVIILKDFKVLNPMTLGCAATVVICGILAATDFKELLAKNKD